MSSIDRKIVKSAGILSLNTIISRVLGLIREIIFASLFGANYVTDAFRVAYVIPYMLRRLLGEGAMSAFLVPVFTDIRVKEGDEAAKRFAYSAYTTLGLIVILVVILGIFIAPQLVYIIAPGLKSEPEAFKLAIKLARIMLPYMFLMMTSAMSMGLLNSYKHFFSPSLAPVVMNIAYIGAMLWLCPRMGESIDLQIMGLAFGVLTGGVLQILVQIPAQFKYGIKYRPIFNFIHKGIKRMLMLMGPAILVIGVIRLNLLVDNFLASLLGEGFISILNYGERLLQFPLGIIGFAVSTSALPLLSEYFSENKIDKMKKTIRDALLLAFIVAIPATFGLFALGKPAIKLIFEHGRFTPQDTYETARVLYAYSLGLIGFIGVQVIVPGFYSMQDTRTPIFGAIANLILNAGLSFLFMKYMGLMGIVIATSIASYGNFIVNVYLLRKNIGILGLKHLTKSIVKVTLASVPMALSSYYTHRFISGFFTDTIIYQVINFSISVIVGIFVFLLFCIILRADETLGLLKAILKRIFRRTKP
jgi:putative peptidoglycan lipid II flippase